MNFGKTESDGRASQSGAIGGEPLPQRRSDIIYRTIEGETVILNRNEGRLHQLNPTASFIWNCCDGTSHDEKRHDKKSGLYNPDYFNHGGQFLFCLRRIWGQSKYQE